MVGSLPNELETSMNKHSMIFSPMDMFEEFQKVLGTSYASLNYKPANAAAGSVYLGVLVI